MAKNHSHGIGSLKADSDADNIPLRTGKAPSSRSLEILLLGLLSACVGVLFLF